MSIEAIFCAVALILAYPVAKDISAHYVVMLLANLVLTDGYAYDSTLIAIVFTVIAIVDSLLGLYYGRIVLLVSAALSILVAFEQLLNLDTLLTNLVYADAAITAWIIIVLAMEWRKWARSRRLSS